MQYTLAVFDLDGTLLDTLDDLRTSLNVALEKAGMPQRSKDEVRRFVGNGIRKLLERAAPEDTPAAEIDRLYETFSAHYALHCAEQTAPYPGILPLLRTLRAAGMRTAVVSNKADYAVQPLVQQYFPGLFDAAAGEREGVRRKPAPDAVFAVLDALGMTAGEAVYIGDSDVDLATARNAGLPCISVAWGFRSREFLLENGAEQIVSDAMELQRLLLPGV